MVILNCLQELESYVNGNWLKRRPRAIRFEDKLCNWTLIITGRRFDRSDAAWRRFKKVKDFRNALIHYDPKVTDLYAQGTVEMARQAVESSLAMILRFYECLGQAPPAWTQEIVRQVVGAG